MLGRDANLGNEIGMRKRRTRNRKALERLGSRAEYNQKLLPCWEPWVQIEIHILVLTAWKFTVR
jgi:hypothetical protein